MTHLRLIEGDLFWGPWVNEESKNLVAKLVW